METRNIIGYNYAKGDNITFRAVDPALGISLPGDFYIATLANVEEAMDLAWKAFNTYQHIGKNKKATFLRTIAEELKAISPELIERAMSESGLPAPRLQGELGRTTNQLNMFANLLEEGSWVEAIIDTAIPDRQPLPRVDIRKMLVPLGPAVVFGASNFPLAFSVAGGDTAAALAAGCPVIVKAHPAHPGSSALVANVIKKVAEAQGLPEGVFSLLYDDGYVIGEALVKHPKTKIVTFTGSFKGGTALMKLARERDEPIPVFAEMGSINPIVLLPLALQKRAEELAKIYTDSITMSVGQFCTNPGLLIAIKSDGLNRFKTALAAGIANINSATMLTPCICSNYQKLVNDRLTSSEISVIAHSDKLNVEKENQGLATVSEISAADFLANEKYKEEVFGPYSLLVVADDINQLEEVLNSLHGQLTATVMADAEELPNIKQITNQLAILAGRVILNNPPTGVEVGNAMMHGGPFPATSDSRFTSVGTSSIKRFVRPVCWQNWNEDLLPDELKTDNPLKIWRLFNNEYKK